MNQRQITFTIVALFVVGMAINLASSSASVRFATTGVFVALVAGLMFWSWKLDKDQERSE